MPTPLKLAHSFPAQPDHTSSTEEIIAALAEARRTGVEASAVEEQAGLRPGALRRDYENLGLLNASAQDPVWRLASHFLIETCSSGSELRFARKNFYRFGGQVWRPTEKTMLARDVGIHMREHEAVFGPPDHKICREVVGLLQDFCAGERPDGHHDDSVFLNLRSCELHRTPGGEIQARRHRPWSNQTSVCDYDYDPTATCPHFDEVFEDIFSANEEPTEMLRHFREIMALGVLPDRQLPTIVLFQGAGANGKSVALKVLASLVADDQTMWSSIRRISGDSFSLPELEGKRLFIDDDASDNVVIDQGLLKSVAEDKPIMARRAHDPHSRSFRARILPIISTNGSPRFHETSHGFARRLFVVPFRRRFDPSEMDPEIALSVMGQRSGILNRLLKDHDRLMARGRFDPPDECIAATVEALAQGNDLRAFLDEAIEPKPGAKVRTADIYDAYRRWQTSNGGKVGLTLRQLKPKLVSMGFIAHKSHGQQCILDIAIKAALSKEAAND